MLAADRSHLGPRRRVSAWTVAVGAIIVGALILRLWGIRNGLPWSYNADEATHFTPQAIGMFRGDLNPHYFVNPPAFTYVIHLLLRLRFLTGEGVWSAYAKDPGQVIVVARVGAALLGAASVWLIYLAGKRLIDKRVGLLASLILATSFLPVFYGHLALNDAPTLAPIAFGLWAIAGIIERGSDRDYLLAGLALGLASAFKYTGGILIVPLLLACAIQAFRPGQVIIAIRGLILAFTAAILGFFIGNPFALLDFEAFWDGVVHQSTASGEGAQDKLGLVHRNGLTFYLWTMTWGFGLIPAVAALFGALELLFSRRRLLLILVPAPIIFIVFMGLQDRYFGRWMLPIYPFLAILAGSFVIAAVDLARREFPVVAPTVFVVGAILLSAQGVWKSVHLGKVLSKEDTRSQLRKWMVKNVPEGQRIVLEPVVPTQWLTDPGKPGQADNGQRWSVYRYSPVPWNFDGSDAPGGKKTVYLDQYVRSLDVRLVKAYGKGKYCWWITGSTQRGRAEIEPEKVPRAIAYYAKIGRRGEVKRVFSPYKPNAKKVKFDFDWSFDYYPSAFERSGPELIVYKLNSDICKDAG